MPANTRNAIVTMCWNRVGTVPHVASAAVGLVPSLEVPLMHLLRTVALDQRLRARPASAVMPRNVVAIDSIRTRHATPELLPRAPGAVSRRGLSRIGRLLDNWSARREDRRPVVYRAGRAAHA